MMQTVQTRFPADFPTLFSYPMLDREQAAGPKHETPVRTVSGEPAETYRPRKTETGLAPYPVNVRGLALSVLTTIVVVFSLQWAVKFLVPMALGILLAFTLNPVVKALERLRIKRSLASLLVIAVVLTGIGFGVDRLRGEFQSIVIQLPDAARRLVAEMTSTDDGTPSTIEQVQKAATELEKAATPGSESRRPRKEPEADRPHIRVSELLWAGSMGAMEFLAQATMVVFLLFFLLTSGDTFKRKLVKLTGPSLSNKRITVQILDEINTSVQGYMFMLLVTNSLLALMMWGTLRWVGLENAGAWAVAAGFLHLIPYFGPLLITLATGLSAFVQFGSLTTALLVAGSSLAIATFIGIFVTTWMTGKIARMNPTAVFVGLLFWGWLWGVWGLLLGIPIVVVLKVVAEHVEAMHGVAELLSD
jgi:predicted PurR-regulated permease PerM